MKKTLSLFAFIPLFACAAEQTAYQIIRVEYGFMNTEKFLNFLQGNTVNSFFEGKSVLAVLFAAFIGGIALNLTPCVLPMIPVNLSIIGAADKSNRKQAIIRASVYASGMILACGGAGVAAVLGGASLGGIAATWYFNLIAAVVFVLLGLSMFDLFVLDLTKYQAKIKPPAAAKLIGVFLLGGMTALLAGACVAPVVIAIMIYSAGLYASGEAWGLILPFLFGAGMAVPWPLLASGIAFLPKPGAWMNQIKHVFGIIIILVGVYYGVQTWNLLMPEKNHTAENNELTLELALEHSEKSGKPVLIDFYADWCKNCIAMEHSTFQKPEVKDALKEFEFVRFDATDTSSQEVQKMLNQFQIKGLPAFVIVKPKKD